MAEEHGAAGLLHKKFLGLPAPVWIGAGGLVVVFVLAHRNAGGAALAPAAAGAPDLAGGTPAESTAADLQTQQQQQQLGYQSALDQLDLAYRGLQLQQFGQQVTGTPAGQNVAGTAIGTQGGNTVYSYGNGTVSRAWQQIILNGQQAWEDIFHPGHIISEQQAQQLAPSDHGPYASPANAVTFGNLTGIHSVGDFINRVVQVGIGYATGTVPAGYPTGGFPVGQPSVSRPPAPTAPAQSAPVLIASTNPQRRVS